MKILIGCLRKISNSDLNLYIVHLWANQCSCDRYVDGESVKIEKFMLSVVSRSCLCLFLVMSRCCFGVALLFFLAVFWASFSDVLVKSRACFGEVSVMCGDGSVMFMMMSG